MRREHTTGPAPDVAPPLVAAAPAGLLPEQAFAALAGLPHRVFFDSARRGGRLGRYSYVAADPFDWLAVAADGSAALGPWAERLGGWAAPRIAGLPPWQGGAAGLLGYEIGRSLERLPRAAWDEFRMPALAMGLYDTLIAFDHELDKAWVISHGFPAAPGPPRRRRAESRLADLAERLSRPHGGQPSRPGSAIERDRLAPQFPTPYGRGVTSDFSRDAYLRAVEGVIGRLRKGDAYQVNLAQRLLLRETIDPARAYERLRVLNPAPFGAYLDGGRWQVASASPERFLRVEQGGVETRPIKGTRPLGRAAGLELAASEKDRAENVMIVDLLRNDLSRVCTDDSIRVPELFSLEQYAHVQHLVSAVTGRLREGRGVADLLAATLPGGSVTGAPKIRAQELIAEYEPTARGAYCGAMAWVGFADEEGHQAMDSSVLIRTLTFADGWVQAPVGGGVTVLSDPVAEYDETWHKAAGLIDAVSPG
ncbi:anthranilate synthase component I family protein [Botrimarina sp.]|uniref:anthranilate synthase component I family protein n=1 Tax=Botrimarina sp. TaxID=2795802 RepID=UPI0032EB45EC